MNDLWPGYYQSLPSQKEEAALQTNKVPLTEEYDQYTKEGFLWLQNWVANAILRDATKNNDASIAVMVSPFKSDSVSND